MNNREEAYITFCKSHDGNWSARDLFNGGYQAGLASQAAELSSNPLQLPTMSQFANKTDYEAAMKSQAQPEVSEQMKASIIFARAAGMIADNRSAELRGDYPVWNLSDFESVITTAGEKL